MLFIYCHAEVAASTRKQPFKREKGDLMHGMDGLMRRLTKGPQRIALGR